MSVSFILVSCKSQKTINQTNADQVNPIITLSKSSCFGKCKVYNLKVYEDRTVIYEGVKNVERIGIFKSIISEHDYNSLINLFESVNFQDLNPTYLTGVRDKQKMTLGYSQKEVKYQNRAASKELKEITKKIESITEQMDWEKN